MQTSSSICNDLINGGFDMALGELGKSRVFSRFGHDIFPFSLWQQGTKMS